MQMLSPGLRAGDYVIVEDSNLDGHPVYPGWGPSPYDAVTEFLAFNRRAFRRDVAREAKFGWTQVPARASPSRSSGGGAAERTRSRRHSAACSVESRGSRRSSVTPE